LKKEREMRGREMGLMEEEENPPPWRGEEEGGERRLG
jgi:hypothetical protein